MGQSKMHRRKYVKLASDASKEVQPAGHCNGAANAVEQSNSENRVSYLVAAISRSAEDAKTRQQLKNQKSDGGMEAAIKASMEDEEENKRLSIEDEEALAAAIQASEQDAQSYKRLQDHETYGFEMDRAMEASMRYEEETRRSCIEAEEALAAAIQLSEQDTQHRKELEHHETDYSELDKAMKASMRDKAGNRRSSIEAEEALAAAIKASLEHEEEHKCLSAKEEDELPAATNASSAGARALLADSSVAGDILGPAASRPSSASSGLRERMLKICMGRRIKHLPCYWHYYAAGPGEIMASIKNAVHQAYGSEHEYSVLYCDEDDEKCTLVEDTVKHFLAVQGQSDPCKRSSVRIFVEGVSQPR